MYVYGTCWFYVCCGVCGNVCCVVAIVKDSCVFFWPWSVEVCCMRTVMSVVFLFVL